MVVEFPDGKLVEHWTQCGHEAASPSRYDWNHFLPHSSETIHKMAKSRLDLVKSTWVSELARLITSSFYSWWTSRNPMLSARLIQLGGMKQIFVKKKYNLNNNEHCKYLLQNIRRFMQILFLKMRSNSIAYLGCTYVPCTDRRVYLSEWENASYQVTFTNNLFFFYTKNTWLTCKTCNVNNILSNIVQCSMVFTSKIQTPRSYEGR